MKEFTKHLQNKMLITQAIYKSSINQSHCSYPQYFMRNQVWLNACNLSTAHSIIKLNNQHISSFSVKHIFKRNPLIVELKFSTFMKIHSVFYIFFVSHVTTDLLPGQQQEPQEPVVAENGN